MTGESLLWAPSKAREPLRGQCVQEVCYYVDQVWGLPVIWADAADWFEGGVYSQYYDRIPYDGSNRPPVGAVVVMSKDLPGSGGAGHIMVNLSAPAGASTFISLDQNWGGKTVHRVTHNFNYVLGWIVPKGGMGGGTETQGAEDVIHDLDNEFWRMSDLFLRIRGRAMSREEFRKYLVGQTWLRAVEILSDDPEATAAEHAQEVGQVAVRDKWDQQIYGLQDALKQQQDLNNQLNQTVTQLQSADANDKATIKAGLDKIANLTAQLEAVHDQQIDLQKAAQDVPENTTTADDKPSPIARLLALLLKLKK